MEDDLRDEMQVLDKTWQKMTAKVHQEGFREGADEGRNRSFQQGFDQGYAQGFSTAFTQACFNGALRHQLPKPESLTGRTDQSASSDVSDVRVTQSEARFPDGVQTVAVIGNQQPGGDQEVQGCQ
ncbi:hypothetical protein M8J76_000048 [Diaphorina citri]|nr:hypothetical protein M8J76_000048 [Diaphorina citri]